MQQKPLTETGLALEDQLPVGPVAVIDAVVIIVQRILTGLDAIGRSARLAAWIMGIFTVFIQITKLPIPKRFEIGRGRGSRCGAEFGKLLVKIA